MKILPSIFILFLSLLASSNALSREFVIAVSPYMEASAAKQQAKTVLRFLTELEPGDTAIILNGYNLTLIGDIWRTPENPAYRSPKARLGVNRKVVSALLRFASNATPPGSERQPAVIGALRLPQLLRHIGENFPASNTLDVVILGSPLYEDLETPQLSMTNQRFPGDGHLFASAGKTPYSAAGNPQRLSGLRVHIGYIGSGALASDRHRYFVKRFWTLFMEAQGGTLTSFIGDHTTLFHRVKNGVVPIKHDYKPVQSDKLEMIRLCPIEVQQSIYKRPVTTEPLRAENARRAERVEIGISWDCEDCDLDLYAQAYPRAQVLYFGHTTSPEGRYWKDYRNAPDLTKGRETIAFTVPLDLRALRIAVNFYSGSAPNGTSGEVRLSIDGNTYAAPFHFETTTGNQGAGMQQVMEAGTANTRHTLFIEPLQVVGLR